MTRSRRFALITFFSIIIAGRVEFYAQRGQVPFKTRTVITNAPPIVGGIPIFPSDVAQTVVAASPVGSTFVIKSGTHRQQSISPRNGDTFIGEPGAILSGAKILTGQTSVIGGFWKFTGQTQEGTVFGNCQSGYSRCGNPEELFYDNIRQQHVATQAELGVGKWFFNYTTNEIYVGTDPTGHTVETSVTTTAFNGTGNNVTIDGVTVTKYANIAQAGAIHSENTSGWNIRNCEVYNNHGGGIRIGHTELIENNKVHDNGEIGIHGVGDNTIVRGNEIAFNNADKFDYGWEGGGTKFVNTLNLLLENNYVHHNEGPGLWMDIDNRTTTIRNNTAEYNSGTIATTPGIFVEISYGAVIYGNFVRYNGLGYSGWIWGSGILNAASPNVEIYNNVVEYNGDGIGGAQQSRGSGAYGPHEISNFYVHDNIVRMNVVGSWSGLSHEAGNDATYFNGVRNNRFRNNTYYLYGDTNHFTWNNQDDRSWVQWTGTYGQDTTGSYTLISEGNGYRPHIRGFGSDTRGGRGGGDRVCHITTLTISGTPTWGASGDIADCLAGLPPGCPARVGTVEQCARFVVSDVSGYTGAGLGNNMDIVISGPYLSFPGQTAPTSSEGSGGSGVGGLSLIGVRIVVDTHDVVLQHFRMRTYQGHQGPWGYYPDMDCTGVGCSVINCILCIGEGNDGGDNSHVYNVLLDHISLAWGGGGTWTFLFASHGGDNNVQMVDCLVAEPTDIGEHNVGGYAGGIVGGSTSKIVFARNAFISSWGRNPLINAPTRAVLYNNVIYNGIDNTDLEGGYIYGQAAFFSYIYEEATDVSQAAFLNNIYIPGPDSTGLTKFFALSISSYDFPNVKVYLDGNTGPGTTGLTGNGQWTGTFAGSGWPENYANVATGGTGSNVRVNNTSDWVGDWLNDSGIPDNLIPNSGTTIRDAVLANAGAFPLDRDAADTRFASDVVNGTGTNHINWAYIVANYPGRGDGLPALGNRVRTVVIPASPNSPGSCGGSLTVIECAFETGSFGAERLEDAWTP